MASKNTILKKKWLLTLNQDIDPYMIIQQLLEVQKYFAIGQTITPPIQNSNVLIKIWIEVKEPRDDSFIKIREDLHTLKCQTGENQLKRLTKGAMELVRHN